MRPAVCTERSYSLSHFPLCRNQRQVSGLFISYPFRVCRCGKSEGFLSQGSPHSSLHFSGEWLCLRGKAESCRSSFLVALGQRIPLTRSRHMGFKVSTFCFGFAPQHLHQTLRDLCAVALKNGTEQCFLACVMGALFFLFTVDDTWTVYSLMALSLIS